MNFKGNGDLGLELDALSIQLMIECFEKTGESGPHSVEGLVLSKILNHCVVSGIAFSLVFIPEVGYYLKKGVVEGVVPVELHDLFGVGS